VEAEQKEWIQGEMIEAGIGSNKQDNDQQPALGSYIAIFIAST
jgi:hypothetical protein